MRFVFGVLTALFMLAVVVAVMKVASATAAIKIKTEQVSPKDHEIDLIGAFDGPGKGERTLVLVACGTQISMTADPKKVTPDEFNKAAMKEIDKACK